MHAGPCQHAVSIFCLSPPFLSRFQDFVPQDFLKVCFVFYLTVTVSLFLITLFIFHKNIKLWSRKWVKVMSPMNAKYYYAIKISVGQTLSPYLVSARLSCNSYGRIFSNSTFLAFSTNAVCFVYVLSI